MAKLVCLLVVLAVIQTCFALKCYKCGAGTSKPCKEEQIEEVCGKAIPSMKSVCQKVTDKDGIVFKDCGTVKEDGYTSTCKMDNGENKCVCDGDLCNSASAVTFSSIALAGVIVSLLLNKMFLH